jgi:hypothetical protein
MFLPLCIVSSSFLPSHFLSISSFLPFPLSHPVGASLKSKSALHSYSVVFARKHITIMSESYLCLYYKVKLRFRAVASKVESPFNLNILGEFGSSFETACRLPIRGNCRTDGWTSRVRVSLAILYCFCLYRSLRVAAPY